MRIAGVLPLCWILFASHVWAGVSLKFLAKPENPVLVHTPAALFFAIQNDGTDPLFIPVNDYNERGWYVHIRKGDVDVPFPFDWDFEYDKMIWLEPGERYIFFDDLQYRLQAQGDYEIEVILKSKGTCLAPVEQSTKHHIREIPFLKRRANNISRYECWSGEVHSQRITLEVRKPWTALETSAFSYVENIGGSESFEEKLKALYPHLKSEYPLSHYTYTAGYLRFNYTEIRQLQPNNTLDPFVHMKQADEDVRYHHVTPDSVLPSLSTPFRDYLAQGFNEKNLED